MNLRRLRKEVEELEAKRRRPEDDAERERQKREIRATAEHMNNCAHGEPLFEITEDGDVFCAADGKPVTTWVQLGAEESYRDQLEWIALHLVRGIEPDFTLDEEGVFRTLDGRFALSRERMDLGGLMGPRTQRIEEATPPERWHRFLAADEEACDLLERLLQLGEDAAVPETFREPLYHWHELGEINDQLGNRDLGSIFVDAEEREATRRLTWTLIHNRGARVMLSELTRRRDAFVREEGSMPTDFPPY